MVDSLRIPTSLFSFKECLRYLGRNEQECSHVVVNGRVYTVLAFDRVNYKLEISHANETLLVQSDQPFDMTASAYFTQYLRDWFDLDTDLSLFYTQVEKDPSLGPLVDAFRGLRMVRMGNFFEALCWSILGQQINLRFAYQLKRQFAARYGAPVEVQGHTIYKFPEPEQIATLDIDTLREIQFSKQKANYIIGVAQAFCEGRLDKGQLKNLAPEEIHKELVALKGIGNWTANYILMKVFGVPSAFPIEDVGLHNALKIRLGLDAKPNLEQIRTLAKPWAGWEAYATFYLWHSLLD